MGLPFIFIGIIILLVNLGPVIFLEVQYQLPKSQKEWSFAPVDSQFSIIIPKVEINAKVIPDVDPFNAKEYKAALEKGAAHAKGTSYPDKEGNVFIFAHSTRFAADVQQYNAVFYLVDKLETGDDIHLAYKEKIYHYKVKEKKIIDPAEIEFLENTSKEKTLTLMTCTPAGTTLKRLLVIGQLIDPS